MEVTRLKNTTEEYKRLSRDQNRDGSEEGGGDVKGKGRGRRGGREGEGGGGRRVYEAGGFPGERKKLAG